MAYFKKMIGYSSTSGEPLFEMELPWWNESELRHQIEFGKVYSDGYLDYEADLSVEQARELHEYFRPDFSAGPYAYEAWQKTIQPQLQELDAVFSSRAQEFAHFQIKLMEWESGLGFP